MTIAELYRSGRISLRTYDALHNPPEDHDDDDFDTDAEDWPEPEIDNPDYFSVALAR